MAYNGNPASVEFKRIINNIRIIGDETKPRDQKVRELLLQLLEINPYHPIIDFPDRPFSWKYFAGELCWYLLKDTSLNYIQPFSTFWNNLADKNGHINSNYGNLLFGKQLRWVYDSLKKDKDSRQAIAFLNQPKFQQDGNKDFVCTIYLNFFIRKNKLHMKMTIRSNDLIFGFSYDAPFFSFVMQHMYIWLKEIYPELELGIYYHYADNIHYYERHFNIIEKIIKNEMKTPPLFILKERMFDIDVNGQYIINDKTKQLCNDVYNNTFKYDNQSHESYYKLMVDSGFFNIEATF